MRVLVLTDAQFAQREHLLLTRLEIGLADDGASVIHVVPRSCSPDIANAFSSTVIRYDDTPTPLGRASRARQLLTAAAEQLDVGELRVDLIHVFGSKSWSLGRALAGLTGASLVLEVWRRDLIARAARAAAPSAGARGPLRRRVALVSSSEKIAAELRRLAAPSVHVATAPWGVPPGDASRSPLDPGQEHAIAVSVIAEAQDAGDIRPLFDALHRLSRRDPRVLVFLDGAAADRPGVWRSARRLGLLERLTAVADMEGRREPVLQTDILVIPESSGVCRTLPLAAMAEGVAVVARPDPYHAEWLNQTTARLVGTPQSASSAEWEAALQACIEDPARTSALRAGARSLVRQQRTLTSYVAGVRRAYDQVVGADAASPTTVIM